MLCERVHFSRMDLLCGKARKANVPSSGVGRDWHDVRRGEQAGLDDLLERVEPDLSSGRSRPCRRIQSRPCCMEKGRSRPSRDQLVRRGDTIDPMGLTPTHELIRSAGGETPVEETAWSHPPARHHKQPRVRVSKVDKTEGGAWGERGG